MKKITLITLLLIPFLGIAQTTKPIEGFLGIKFGSSKLTVIAAMKAKRATLDKENSTDQMLLFENVKLGDRAANAFFVYMYKDKAYCALFVFTPDDEPQTVEYYDNLVKDIAEIYGAGTPTKSFQSPFEDGDGNEILALEKGYAKMFTDWKSDTKSIQVAIDNKTDRLNVVVNYSDDALQAEKDAEQKAKEKSDY